MLFAVNSGGVAYAAQNGVMYTYDQYFTGGSEGSATGEIEETQDDVLYRSERWGTFSYHFPVKAGSYDVNLHMVEAYYDNQQVPGRRVFDVEVEGETLVPDFNPLTAGHKVAQVVELKNIEVSDGELTLAFNAAEGEANVAAIVVRGLEGNAEEGDPTVVEGTVGDAPVPADCQGEGTLGQNDFVVFDGGKFPEASGEFPLHGNWATFNVWNEASGLSTVDVGEGSALKFSNRAQFQGFKIAPPKVAGQFRPFKLEGVEIWMEMENTTDVNQLPVFGLRITFPGEDPFNGGANTTTWLYDDTKQDAGKENVVTVPGDCNLISMKTPASWNTANDVAELFTFETKRDLPAGDSILIRRIVLKGLQFAD